jgi:hypothetical protein
MFCRTLSRLSHSFLKFRLPEEEFGVSHLVRGRTRLGTSHDIGYVG